MTYFTESDGILLVKYCFPINPVVALRSWKIRLGAKLTCSWYYYSVCNTCRLHGFAWYKSCNAYEIIPILGQKSLALLNIMYWFSGKGIDLHIHVYCTCAINATVKQWQIWHTCGLCAYFVYYSSFAIQSRLYWMILCSGAATSTIYQERRHLIE